MLRLMDVRIADNSIGVTFAGNDANLRDSLVVGATKNETGPAKTSTRNCQFADSSSTTAASAWNERVSSTFFPMRNAVRTRSERCNTRRSSPIRPITREA